MTVALGIALALCAVVWILTPVTTRTTNQPRALAGHDERTAP